MDIQKSAGPASGQPGARPPMAQASASPFDFSKLLRWARESIAGMAGPFVAVTALSVFTTLLSQYNAQLIANFITQAQSGPTAVVRSGFDLLGRLLPSDAAWSAVLFAITAVTLIVLGFSNRVAAVWLNSTMVKRLQLRLHDKLLVMGPAYHGKHDMGENTALVTQFANAAQPAFRDVLSFPFDRGVSLAGAIAFLFYNLSGLNSQGVIYALLAVLLLVLPAGSVWLSGQLSAAFTEVRDRQMALSNTLVDSLTAPQEVQLMAAGAQRSSAFAAALDALGLAQLRAAMRNETSNQFQAAVPTLLQVGLVLWAVYVAGGDAIRAVVGIYLFVPRIVQPIQELLGFYTRLVSTWPQVERVGRLLDASPEVTDAGKRSASDLDNYVLRLENLSFRPEERTIIDDLTHTFESGKITALVGRSGSGKTTIFRMVARLFDPTVGRVTIGGTDVRDFKIAQLRAMSATVSQFPLFIEASVRENLRLGRADATDADMKHACMEADVWEALARISPGDPLAALVPRLAGKAGLAGGERRRLSIARTLLTDAPILLLDEPSTGIDALSVSKIIGVLRSRPDRTILIIDHDMDLIRAVADVVCCLENGKFVDVGSPEEMLQRPTLFKSLLDLRRAYASGGDLEVTGTVPVRPAIPTATGLSPTAAAERPPAQPQRKP
jgi:ABC-type multidrug transport system fused ATPase/permease subunit